MTSEPKIDLPRAVEEMRAAAERWREVFRVPDLSLGVYRLARGETDPQTPHGEDEIYYVLSGRCVLRVGDRELPLGPGEVAFVPARAEHRFHDIAEDLTLLVFFAPAEGSRAV
jgi:mannose-6-phosphate isomerase-like protein (cupin superfamily)